MVTKETYFSLSLVLSDGLPSERELLFSLEKAKAGNAIFKSNNHHHQITWKEKAKEHSG